MSREKTCERQAGSRAGRATGTDLFVLCTTGSHWDSDLVCISRRYFWLHYCVTHLCVTLRRTYRRAGQKQGKHWKLSDLGQN